MASAEKPSVLGPILGLAVLSALSGAAIALSLGATLSEIEGRAAQRMASLALSRGRADEGVELSIVRQLESKKYSFLNKKIYEVYTSSTSREGSALSADLPEDRARAERHAEARRGQPLRTPLSGGRLRVTIADGARSAELVLIPKQAARPAIAGYALGLFVFAALLALVLSRLRPGTAASVVPALFGAILGFVALALRAVDQAGVSASALLASIEDTAPSVRLPPGPTLGALGVAVLLGALATLGLSGDRAARARQAWARYRGAYLAIAPAMSGLLVLVGVPFLFGVALSLFHHENGRFSFVGLANFSDILSSAGSEGLKPGTLPYGLLMTVAWTAANVSLHLGFGLFFALMLRRVSTGAARIYRVLLIIPWAVPSYLTALIFRSMFDPDTGAINRLLGLSGFSWMHQTGTAFLANLITNVWLGVPFMMVVCLGALTSIPEDIYEAAEVDGASRARQFWRLTLPLLRPALLPSVILGSIWTFNKFEIIYLVSEGRPDGATDILVTESYRWAFERGLAQGGAYGYAAAYSVVIFGVLLLYSWMTSRVAKAAEDALR